MNLLEFGNSVAGILRSLRRIIVGRRWIEFAIGAYGGWDSMIWAEVRERREGLELQKLWFWREIFKERVKRGTECLGGEGGESHWSERDGQ